MCELNYVCPKKEMRLNFIFESIPTSFEKAQIKKFMKSLGKFEKDIDEIFLVSQYNSSFPAEK